MDASAYNKLTSAPDVFGVGTLDATIRCLQSTGSKFAKVVIEAAREPIEKPAQHHAPGRPNFFRLTLLAEEVDEIAGDLLNAEAQGVSLEG